MHIQPSNRVTDGVCSRPRRCEFLVLARQRDLTISVSGSALSHAHSSRRSQSTIAASTSSQQPHREDYTVYNIPNGACVQWLTLVLFMSERALAATLVAQVPVSTVLCGRGSLSTSNKTSSIAVHGPHMKSADQSFLNAALDSCSSFSRSNRAVGVDRSHPDRN